MPAATLQRIGTHRAKGLELFEKLLDLDAYGIQNTLLELVARRMKITTPKLRVQGVFLNRSRGKHA